MTHADLFAVALDPLAERVMLSDESLAVVFDYVDDELEPAEPDEADIVIYIAADGEYRAAMIDGLFDFTVH